ncbi:DUF6705 family protein [uncultured Lacinutrix sp.]|uniref:DUF6705 family protein n=1 Tax=uncultured Lacinutrix sp. TaxID=574032 RepID=UPI00261D8ECE|nr:DUF6705 family protein [uncultured Lacinutrix sp.]
MFRIKILILLITSFSITGVLAQDVIIPLDGGSMSDSQDPRVNDRNQDVYYKDLTNIFGKYLHTWVYDNGTTYLKISFTKKERARISSTRFFMDQLNCEFLYKENGVTIYDTYLTNGGLNFNIDKYIFGSRILSTTSLELMYDEPPLDGSCERYASGKLTLNYIDGSTPTINWSRINNHLYGSEDKCADGTSKDLTDFVIPANMTLVKQ